MGQNLQQTGRPMTIESPLAQAAAAVGGSLRDLERIAAARRLDLGSALKSVGDAHLRLLRVSEQGGTSADEVRTAMNHLRDALGSLQSVSFELAPGLEEATRTVAKVLAMLYPLSKPNHPPVPRPGLHGRESVPRDIAERRRTKRLPVDAEVGFQSDTNFFMGFSEDISTGGLFVATYDTRPLGAVMNLNFTLPGGHLISVDGVVRWVREYNETSPDVTPGMGVQFENLRKDDKAAIEHFIAERPAMFYDDE